MIGAISTPAAAPSEQATPKISVDQRLPLLEIAFPALKRRPRAFVQRFIACIDEVVRADSRVDSFEFLLATAVRAHLSDALAPAAAAVSGRLTIAGVMPEVAGLLSVIAAHGHADDAGAATAYLAGMRAAGVSDPEPFERRTDWVAQLEPALSRLDQLRPSDKEILLRAMVAVVLADDRVAVSQLELLRAAAAAIHLPLPPLHGAEEPPTDALL